MAAVAAAKAKPSQGELAAACLLKAPAPVIDIGVNLADPCFDKVRGLGLAQAGTYHSHSLHASSCGSSRPQPAGVSSSFAPRFLPTHAPAAPRPPPQDRDEVLQRAADAGVAAVVVTGCCVASARAAAAICDGPSPVPLFFTAGVHPHNAKDCDESTLGELRALAAHEKCVAIGARAAARAPAASAPHSCLLTTAPPAAPPACVPHSRPAPPPRPQASAGWTSTETSAPQTCSASGLPSRRARGRPARAHTHRARCARPLPADAMPTAPTSTPQPHTLNPQVALALELRKPLFMHCRDAGDAFAEILRAAGGSAAAGNGGGGAEGSSDSLAVPGVLHCFTGSGAELAQCVALGLHIGITGWVCDDRPERGGAEVAGLLSSIPPGRLMIETDAPYLVPRTIKPSKARPHRNEPSLLPHVLAQVAASLGRAEADVAAETSAAAAAFFGLPAAVTAPR